MKVLIFGNTLLENDSLPIRILPFLRKAFKNIEFKEIDPTEGLENEGRSLVIIDTVQGIDKVIEINSIEQLQETKIYSMHDFDLAYNLKILKKLDLIDNVRIIGVPMKISEFDAFNQIQFILRKWAAQLMQGS